jgi:LmbE family N-acetylglucosaminyl deacetylase
MNHRPRLLPTLAALAFLTAAATRGQDKALAPKGPPTFPGVSSVLWVAAHPDDETMPAPLLSRLCLDEGLRCTFLVFTRGEKGVCDLPGGCRPDLGTVRAAEMARAAQLFHARLIQWRYPDGGAAANGSAGSWDAVAGSHAALLAALQGVITRTGANLVLTFDPRHGTTCHPDHRAVGALVHEALAAMNQPPLAYLLETRLITDSSPVALHFLPAALAQAGVFTFDGNATWKTLEADLQIHASQFDASIRSAVSRVPSTQRAVYLGPPELLLAANDVATCP